MSTHRPALNLATPTQRAATALWVFLALCLGAAAALAQGGKPYQQPDFQKKLFAREAVLLERQEIAATVSALAALASNFPGVTEVDHILRAKALAIALRLDGTEPKSLAANNALAGGEVPSAVSDYNTLPEVARQLWTTAGFLESPEKNRDESVLQYCLVDIARQLDSANLAESNRYPTQLPKATFPGWASIVEGAESGFVFPDNNPDESDPDTTTKPGGSGKAPEMPAPPANPTRAAKGKFLFLTPDGKSITINGDLKAGGGTEPLAIIFANADGDTAIALNDLRPTLVGALTSLQKTWPKDGGVLVLTVPTASGDDNALALSAALLADSLIRDQPLSERCAALGLAAGDGSLLAPDKLSSRLHALTSSGIETIVLPEASIPDLQDMALLNDLAPFFRFQIITVPTLAAAVTAASAEPSEDFTKSLRDFKLVQEVAKDNVLTELTGFTVVRDSLGKITALNPQHASAKILIAHGAGKLPAHLTRLGSLSALYRAAGPIVNTLRKDGTADRDSVLAAYEETKRLKPLLDPDTAALGAMMTDFLKDIGSYSTMAKNDAAAVTLKKKIFTTWDTIRAEYVRLQGEGS